MQGSRDGFLHLLYAIIMAQFVAIAILLGGFSSEYLSNAYYRAWVDGSYPWLAPLLQGQVDALLVGVVLGATFLIIQRFRGDIRVREDVTSALRDTVSRVSADYESPSATEELEDILAELERPDA